MPWVQIKTRRRTRRASEAQPAGTLMAEGHGGPESRLAGAGLPRDVVNAPLLPLIWRALWPRLPRRLRPPQGAREIKGPVSGEVPRATAARKRRGDLSKEFRPSPA